MTPITPELLRNTGFEQNVNKRYKWTRKEFSICYWTDGSMLMYYPFSRITDMETLSTLHEILTGEKLNW
jgi:hypothetical protein